MNKITLSIRRNFILIDSASFIYHRICATISWLRYGDFNIKSLSDIDIHDTDNKEMQDFLDILRSQFDKALDTGLQKITKEYGKIDKIYFIRDCPREDIWRRDHYPRYKDNRASSSDAGRFIKYLNEYVLSKGKYTVLRVDRAEADDVIGHICNRFKNINFAVVTNDSDYNQLLNNYNVNIFVPSKKWSAPIVHDIDTFLHEKILAGDSSDNIPKSLSYDMKRLLIDFSMIPDYLKTNIETAFEGTWIYT